MFKHDNRIVITLDAGGTNLVFGAMRGCEFITEPLTMPSNAHDLDLCLDTMVNGFRQIIDSLDEKPVAISFAFPGPADYPHGIIGGYLPNFPSFRNGVALGPFLEHEFGLPVYINTTATCSPTAKPSAAPCPRSTAAWPRPAAANASTTCWAMTFGTGFGVGMVVNGQLNRGDNSCVETFCLPHKTKSGVITEEGVSVRAVKRVYAEASDEYDRKLEPKDICNIADGRLEGNVEAARRAFAEFGETAGRRHGNRRTARRRHNCDRRRHYSCPTSDSALAAEGTALVAPDSGR